MLNLWGRYNGRDWEHIDSVECEEQKEEVLAEYRMAFGSGWSFRWWY